MKKILMLLAIVFMCTAGLCTCADHALACDKKKCEEVDLPTAISGTWLKLTARSNGYFAYGGDSYKWGIETTCYLNIEGDEEEVEGYSLICEVEPGVWEETSAGCLQYEESYNDKIFYLLDMPVVFAAPSGFWVESTLDPKLVVKINKNGDLKKIKFKSKYSEAEAGYYDWDDAPYLWGSMKVKGRLIDPEKLPFDFE